MIYFQVCIWVGRADVCNFHQKLEKIILLYHVVYDILVYYMICLYDSKIGKNMTAKNLLITAEFQGC